MSYLNAAEKLKPKERGEFLYAVAKYGITGEEIPLRKSLQPLWDAVKPNLEASRKYQTYGEKGGRPKKPPFEKSESPLSEIQKPNKKENMNKNMEVDKNTNMDYRNPLNFEPITQIGAVRQIDPIAACVDADTFLCWGAALF